MAEPPYAASGNQNASSFHRRALLISRLKSWVCFYAACIQSKDKAVYDHGT